MVSVTPRAQEKLKEVLDSNGSQEASVRIAVVGGPHGCVHGWKLAIEDQVDPEDTIVEAGAVRILMEPELVEILDGASVDYREDAWASASPSRHPTPRHRCMNRVAAAAANTSEEISLRKTPI